MHSIWNIVRGASNKWKMIGISLNFKTDKLEIINQSDISRGNPEMCFAVLIEEWLKRCSPPSEPPTVDALVAALREEGEEIIANTLAKTEIITKKKVNSIF